MSPSPQGPFRIYRADPLENDGTGPGPNLAVPEQLASRELLRPGPSRPGHRDLEPFSRGWFEEVEAKRYSPHGAWIRRVLEFTRHANETMLMLGPGIGTDALQYQRHGTEVTVCVTPADQPDLIRRNFELRGLTVRMVHAGPEFTLPFDANAFDLAYLNLLFDPPADLGRAVGEVYRILKPGGKVFVLAPSRYDAGFWERVVLPFRSWYRKPVELTDTPRYSAAALRQLFAQFDERRFSKRHLRRSELPYALRFIPIPILERLAGRVLAMRAFKPISAALQPHSLDHAA